MPKKKVKRQPLRKKVLIPGKDGIPVLRPRLYIPREKSDRILDGFEKEARAGLPDVEIARVANVSVTAVASWRHRRKIQHRRSSGRRADASVAYALNLIGEPLQDVTQRVRHSSLEGQWQPPEYLVRDGVHYNKLMEQLHVLTRHGFLVEDIAEAHGYTVQTVEQALAVYERFLKERK
jgi:hypothetical protein